MHNSVPYMKISLCAKVQLNNTNFDFNLKSSLTPFFHQALQMSGILQLLESRPYSVAPFLGPLSWKRPAKITDGGPLGPHWPIWTALQVVRTSFLGPRHRSHPLVPNFTMRLTILHNWQLWNMMQCSKHLESKTKCFKQYLQIYDKAILIYQYYKKNAISAVHFINAS